MTLASYLTSLCFILPFSKTDLRILELYFVVESRNFLQINIKHHYEKRSIPVEQSERRFPLIS